MKSKIINGYFYHFCCLSDRYNNCLLFITLKLYIKYWFIVIHVLPLYIINWLVNIVGSFISVPCNRSYFPWFLQPCFLFATNQALSVVFLIYFVDDTCFVLVMFSFRIFLINYCSPCRYSIRVVSRDKTESLQSQVGVSGQGTVS